PDSGEGAGTQVTRTNEGGPLVAADSTIRFQIDEQRHTFQASTTFPYTVHRLTESHFDGEADGVRKAGGDSEAQDRRAAAAGFVADQRNAKLTRQGDKSLVDYASTDSKTDRQGVAGVRRTKVYEHHVTASIVVEPLDGDTVELVVEPVGHGSKGQV